MTNKEDYSNLVKERTPKSKEIKTIVFAFLVGGTICCIGQGISDLISLLWIKNIGEKSLAALTSGFMIILGALLTGIGIYDKIGKFAGAGSIVPITGFANSVVSPAMEFNREGVVFGIMSKMFVIAGPIIVSGIVAAIGVGIIYWVVSLI